VEEPEVDPQTPDPTELVPCTMSRIVLSEDSDRQFIYLSEVDGKRSFPIVIGTHEAHEIARVVKGLRHRRPLTHELMQRSLEAVGARLEGVDVVRLERETFFARLRLLAADGAESEVDARPSDAIALALRTHAPMRVARAVLDAAATEPEE
jgi:bifunctional DNase/RNase